MQGVELGGVDHVRDCLPHGRRFGLLPGAVVQCVEQCERHLPSAGVVDVRIVLAGPAVGHEPLHAAPGAHRLAGVPEGRAGASGRLALPAQHVRQRVHRREALLAAGRAFAHAHHQDGRRGEAAPHVGDHLLDLFGVAGVVRHARLHDIQPVLQDHQVVVQHGVDLGVDRGVRPEHRLAVVAAHRVVVHLDARPFEPGAVADEPLRARKHPERERTDLRRCDDDLPHGLVALDGEPAGQRVVDRHLRFGVVRAAEEDAGAGTAVQPFAEVGALPAGRGAGLRRADPPRDVEIVAQRLRGVLALHDVVGGPPLRLGLHRAAERREGRSHRREARAASAVDGLEPLAQVGSEDVALDERVAQHGDAHRALRAEQRVAEAAECAVRRRVEILDGDDVRPAAHGVGPPACAAARRPADRPVVADGGAARGRVGDDPFGDAGQVDLEFRLVVERRFGFGGGRGVVEGDQFGEDVGPAEFDASDALRGYQTQAGQHRDECQGADPAPVGVVFGFHVACDVCRGDGRSRPSRGRGCGRGAQRRRPRIRNT